MSQDEEYLLYPLDTGEDPACLACGKVMMVAAVEERGRQPGFITFRCEQCGRTEKFICEEMGSAWLRLGLTPLES